MIENHHMSRDIGNSLRKKRPTKQKRHIQWIFFTAMRVIQNDTKPWKNQIETKLFVFGFANILHKSVLSFRFFKFKVNYFQIAHNKGVQCKGSIAKIIVDFPA